MPAQFAAYNAPLGLTKPLPQSKIAEYRAISERLKPFQKHVYDIDICVLVRQMEELASKGNEETRAYHNQIRQSAALDLKKEDLNVEYYLDHFYYPILPKSVSYQTYLPLYLCLSNLLKLRPILEYHYYKCEETKGKDFDFLDILEYEVCDYLRDNSFPEEDWIARHDKILDWVYDMRNQRSRERAEAQRWAELVNTLNDKLRTNISHIKVRPFKQIAKEQGGVDILYREMLFEDLKDFFNNDSHDSLKRILAGEDSDEMIVFHGQANQLVDVFRIYHAEGKLHISKQKIFIWLKRHFLYLADNDGGTSSIGKGALNILYGKDLPPKQKRINLSGLEKSPASYYRKNTSQTS